MSSIPLRIGLITSFALAALAATPRDAAAGAPTTLDCANLVPWFQSNNYGWWWGALGNCKQGAGGPTTFEDIFQCGWKQVESQYQLSCVEKDLRGAPNTADAVDVVAFYNGKPTCSYAISYYSRSNFAAWDKRIRSLAVGAPRGLTDPSAIFTTAFRSLPAADQQPCLRDALRTTDVTTAAVAYVANANTPGDCKPLIDTYKANNYRAWWLALGSIATGRGGLSTRDEIVHAAFATLPQRDQQACLLDHLSGAPITEAGVWVVRATNGIDFSVADNVAFEPAMPPEACDLPTDGSVLPDYMAAKIPHPFLEGGGLVTPANYNKPAGQNLGSDEGRLAPDLRRVAQLADPINCALPLAAHAFAAAELPGPASTQDRLRAEAQAFADLAVTGTKAFEKFSTRKPTDEDFCAAIETRTQPSGCLAFAAVTDDEVRAGCRKALSRAYRVANFLRVGQALRVAGPWFRGDGSMTATAAAELLRKQVERLALDWIAVSGEDDAPHRPVNVASSDFPQYNISVDVDAPHQNYSLEVPHFPAPVLVLARYTIAQSQAPAPRSISYDPKTNPYVLDADPVPTIAKGSEVIVFVHGMDSRAEEATDITKHLFARMTESQKNLVIITMDLPSSGYTESLDYVRISPLVAIGKPFGNADFSATGLTPMLDFLETFVVRFIETLPSDLAVRESMKAVMGGSLGGNLTFRLGRRPNTPWLKNVVVWSPASIWTSLGEGNDLLQHAGPRKTWESANDRNSADPDDLFGARLGRRKDFFVRGWDKSILDVIIPMSQPETWTSDSYLCKKAAIAQSRLDRQETYNPLFLTWRWRLAAEQLLYSHQTIELATGQRRFMRNDKRMFLSCGLEDDVFGNEICDATRLTGDVMTLTPGMARYLPVTGHSVDAERPRYFARKLDEFLGLQ